RGDVEAGLPGHPVRPSAQPDDDVAQRAVVDVEHPPPGDVVRVDAERVALVDVVVEHRGQQVVGRRDGVHVAGQVQVERLHGDDLAVPAPGRAALDAERGPHRRLPDCDRGPLPDVLEPLPEADRRGGLALAERRGGDRAHHHVPGGRLAGQLRDGLELDLHHLLAVWLEQARGDAHRVRDVLERLQGRAAGDLQVAREDHGVPLFNPQTQIPGKRKPSTPMPSDSPALTSAPNRYWPDDRSQCKRYEGTPAPSTLMSSLMMSVATPATGARSAAPSGAMSSCRSAPHSRAISSAASGPVIRISARPWVRSTTLTNSSAAESAATVSSQPATAAAAAAPGGASTSHSPGPEPTTSQDPFGSASSRPQRPNGTPSALAIAPFHGARRWTLVSGVQSVIVSAAS